MGLSKMFKKNIARTAKFKEAQENARIAKTLADREKSSNERELERFEKEEREKIIKERLANHRNARQQESMETTVLNGENMFKGKGNIMSGGSSVLKNNDNLFGGKTNMMGGGLFFNK